MARIARFESLLFAIAVATLGARSAAAADSVMVQCGQQYQAAKAAGTLNGLDWNKYRTDCAARLKAQPATAAAPSPTVQPAPVAAAAPPTPATTPPAAAPSGASAPASAAPSGGRAAMLVRQKQCGAEWKAQKVSLIAQTPGLTWPRYWSQCNTRIKTTGH